MINRKGLQLRILQYGHWQNFYQDNTFWQQMTLISKQLDSCTQLMTCHPTPERTRAQNLCQGIRTRITAEA